MPADFEESKRRIELKLTRAQYLLALVALAHLIAFVIGAFLGFIYLMLHHFNPGGISGADTLAMITWSVGFVVTTVIGFGVAAIAALPIGRIISWGACQFEKVIKRMGRGRVGPQAVWLWKLSHGAPNKLEWRKDQTVFLVTGSFLMVLFGVLLYKLPLDMGMFILTMLVGGMFISLNIFAKFVASYSYWPRTVDASPVDAKLNRLTPGKRGAAVTAVLVVVLICTHIGIWLDASALVIGFREQDASIRLNKEDFDTFVEQATRSGIAVNPCEQIVPGSLTVHHVDILWHNMGTRALLRFPSKSLGSASGVENSITFKISNSAIANVVNAGNFSQCAEFLVDTLFQGDGEEIQRKARTYIAEKLRSFGDIGSGTRFRVIAHRDYGESAVSAERSLRQAMAVKSLIETTFNVSASSVDAVSLGQQVAKRECDTGSAMQRAFCEKLNRRIEIQIFR